MTSLAENLNLERIIDDVAKVIFVEHRRASFQRGWEYDSIPNVKCSSEKLALAGFHYSGTADEPTTAKCAFCMKEMIFDDTDDPWEEHVSHKPDCLFVKFAQQDQNQLTLEQSLQLIAYRQVNAMGQWHDVMIDRLESGINEFVNNSKLATADD